RHVRADHRQGGYRPPVARSGVPGLRALDAHPLALSSAILCVPPPPEVMKSWAGRRFCLTGQVDGRPMPEGEVSARARHLGVRPASRTVAGTSCSTHPPEVTSMNDCGVQAMGNRRVGPWPVATLALLFAGVLLRAGELPQAEKARGEVRRFPHGS